mgnify:CR=1 FL=1
MIFLIEHRTGLEFQYQEEMKTAQSKLENTQTLLRFMLLGFFGVISSAYAFKFFSITQSFA